MAHEKETRAVKSNRRFGEAMVAGCLRTTEKAEKRASKNAYSPTSENFCSTTFVNKGKKKDQGC
jgi:hypothetical protein